ncbi:MAG: hypothetical protein N2Z22_07170 [Turneriella sp.]|nr:hypothetical protein [Turneriella sp.]
MDFLRRNRIAILFSGAALILLAALFWPEPKKQGELQKYYSRDSRQLLTLRYRGSMQFREKETVQVDYTIQREENLLHPRDAVYRIQIDKLETDHAQLKKRIEELRQANKFYGSGLVRTMVYDWSAPDYYYILEHDPAKDVEYGLDGCKNHLEITFRAGSEEFCIGAASQGETRRYVLDKKRNKIVITPDYTVRRILNSILAQREQLLQPFGDGADLLEIVLSPEMQQKFPRLREKTGGRFNLRMVVKKDEPTPLNVWHVENLLSIKPSHAAELAQLINAMRIHAILARPALTPEAPLAEILKNAGLSEKAVPAVSGSLMLRKTDQQHAVVTRFAFFAPHVRTAVPLQLENSTVQKLDTLALSAANSGYITADLYPRFAAIFQKFENDLREAEEAGKKEKEKKQENQK